MESISVFVNITTFTDFWRKNADVNRIRVACLGMYTLYRSSLCMEGIFDHNTRAAPKKTMLNRIKEEESLKLFDLIINKEEY